MNEQKAAPHFDYVEEAHLTASPHFHGDKVPFAFYADTLKAAIDALQTLDRVKKTLFYGRDLGVSNIGQPVPDVSKIPEWLSSEATAESDRNAVNIIHGIIGKATEAGELLEALYAATVEDAKFDPVNAGEEVGDGFWYDALILRAIGSTFTEEQRRNIAKLRHRFPDRFTEYDANNRDLFGEREILEKKA